MSRIAQNGRGGNSAPATHDHAGAPWRRQAEALADWALARVVVRRDVYGTYYEAGGQFQQVTAHAPLTRDVLIRRSRGEGTIGAHPIAPEDLCTGVAADIDAHDDAADPDRNWRCALTTAEHLAGYGLQPLVVDSNGRGGYHGRASFSHEDWRFEESHSERLTRCLRRWSTSFYRGPGAGPHHAALRCVMCDQFIKWLPKPRKGGRA
jgi:hypothetical protein